MTNFKKLLLATTATTTSAGVVFFSEETVAKAAEVSSINTYSTSEIQRKESPQEIKVTEADVNEAKEQVNKAEKGVHAKEDAVKAAEDADTKARDQVKDLTDAVQVADQADVIVKEHSQVIEEKTAEKAMVEPKLQDAQSEQNQAQATAQAAEKVLADAQADQAAKENSVKEKEGALNALTTGGDQAQKERLEKDVQAADQSLQDAKAKEANLTDQVNHQAEALKNYEPTVKKTIVKGDPNKQAPEKAADYDYNKRFNPINNGRDYRMEDVDFDGIRNIEIDNSVHEVDFHNFNNKKLSEEFVKLLNELRHKNGIKDDAYVDDKFVEYATLRAQEMAENKTLSHATKYSKDGSPWKEYAHGGENAGYDWVFNWGGENEQVSGMIGEQRDYRTYEQVAYRLLLRWYSDFNNLHRGNYSHRRALFEFYGPAGVGAQLTPEGAIFFNFNYHTNPGGFTIMKDHYGLDVGHANNMDALDKWSREYNNKMSEENPLQPTWKGQPMKFLPEFNYIYVDKEVEDHSDQLAKTLDVLKAQLKDASRAAQNAQSKKEQSENALNGFILALNNKDEARRQAKAALDQAEDALKASTDAKNRAANDLDQASQALDRAKTKTSALENQVADLEQAIDHAKAKKDQALNAAGQKDTLQTQLTEAKEQAVKASETLTHVKRQLKEAKDDLAQAQKTYAEKLSLYNLGKDLIITQDGNHIIAIPKDAPVQEELPEAKVPTLSTLAGEEKPNKTPKGEEPTVTDKKPHDEIKPSVTKDENKPVEGDDHREGDKPSSNTADDNLQEDDQSSSAEGEIKSGVAKSINDNQIKTDDKKSSLKNDKIKHLIQSLVEEDRDNLQADKNKTKVPSKGATINKTYSKECSDKVSNEIINKNGEHTSISVNVVNDLKRENTTVLPETGASIGVMSLIVGVSSVFAGCAILNRKRH
ncbi:hypothetical protein QP101_09375 [Aerococcus urinae]|uniref:CAP domain-containing protein n=1 Tax=Aerococcus urinae TaxID=1376 RepID=UPI00254B8D9F|nr:hypothetical protein [Aerococcus urinae]MDK6372267.1 hypothetical protein [Aerococcus urinae]